MKILKALLKSWCAKGEKMVDAVLLRIAKMAILERFHTFYKLDKEALYEKYPFLKHKGASFVTLKYDGHLRGCIGSLSAHKALLEDVASNARSAAFQDPRFHPLHENELTHIGVEVSVLSEPELLEYKDFEDLTQKVVADIDGLILSHKGHQGTFLPQVWEELKSPKEFLEHLCMKAGLSPLVFEEHPNIFRYRVEAIEENFDAIETL